MDASLFSFLSVRATKSSKRAIERCLLDIRSLFDIEEEDLKVIVTFIMIIWSL